MPLFSEKYPIPYRVPLGGIEVRQGLILVAASKPCEQCGRLTCFVDLNCEAFLCSDECTKSWDVVVLKG